MDLGGVTGKIEGLFYNNAGLIGTAAGLIAGASGINPIIDNVMHIQEWGIPNPGITITEFIVPGGGSASDLTWQFIWLWVGGWILKQTGFGGRLGPGIEKLAKGGITGNAIQHVIHEARYNHL